MSLAPSSTSRTVDPMSNEQILTEVSEGVLTITLNRPERLNAWTARWASELTAAFDAADADDEVRAIIVTGAGRGFCAGRRPRGRRDTFDYRKREHGGRRRARQRRRIHAAHLRLARSR